jgi:hypothetical protein
MNIPLNSPSTPELHKLASFIEPTRQKLAIFYPGVEIDPGQVLDALRRTLKSGRIKGMTLWNDQLTIVGELDGVKGRLLINYACKTIVDRVYDVSAKFNKRIPRHQKDFAFDLDNEIYELENGNETFEGR